LPLLIATAAAAAPVGTAFTYQGQLKLNGMLVSNSQCYFTFRLYDALANGTLIGQVPLSGIGQQGTPVAVSNGLFTADIDFGDGAFNGSARWMETSVCCLAFPFPVGTTCTQTTLSPRQPVNAVPYALGLRLPTAESATTSPAGHLDQQYLARHRADGKFQRLPIPRGLHRGRGRRG
jgi:hypothetical protein